MGFGLSLGLSLSSMFFFMMFMLFGIRSYQNRYKDIKYDIRNTFPYEMNYQLKYLDNVLPNVLLTLYILTSVCFFAFFDIKNLNVFTIFMMASGILLAIVSFFMFFADLKYIRLHLLLVTMLSVSAFASTAFIAVYGFNSFKNDTNILALVIAILAAIFGLFIFILMMNPKLNFRLEMKKAVTPEGKEILVRPKYFVMAFTEWLFIFSIFIDQILILILYLPI